MTTKLDIDNELVGGVLNLRYKILLKSALGHCCISATVLDTENFEMESGEYSWYYNLCECTEVEDAQAICSVMNFMDCGVDTFQTVEQQYYKQEGLK